MALSEETRRNVEEVIEVAKVAFRWACIPTILYLGTER